MSRVNKALDYTIQRFTSFLMFLPYNPIYDKLKHMCNELDGTIICSFNIQSIIVDLKLLKLIYVH